MYTSASTLVTVASFGLLARALPTARSRNEVPITFYAAGGVQLTQSFSTDGAPIAINNGLSISRISSSTAGVTCVFDGIDHSSTTVPGAATVDVGPPQVQTQGYCFVSYAPSPDQASSWVPSPSAPPPTLIQPDDAWTIWAQPTETPSVWRRSGAHLSPPSQGSGDAPELEVEDPPTTAPQPVEPEEPSTTTPSPEEITPPPSTETVVTDPGFGNSTVPVTEPVTSCTTTPAPVTPCVACETTPTPEPVTPTTPCVECEPTPTPCAECESTPTPAPVDPSSTPTPCVECESTPTPSPVEPVIPIPSPEKPCSTDNCPDNGCPENPCPDEECLNNNRPSYSPAHDSGDHIEITFNGEVNADFAEFTQ
ncbi:hypothetical protein BP00DRAFT_415802 [Aspergillus indologenus CBS 114.80]|uniref:Uncharacterized protein n=1 Tax=Aspergillus indologenus CBS 114.80 TaxID=1450541 RepID=A0A2V5IAV6_9EURO|nr:hypothetical protein BP00DRAFT_415802 [Aspergillus indologenus CBS 114.80]